MLLKALHLEGAYIIELQPHKDERGFFARSFCKKTLQERGLKGDILQTNVSFNKKKGTLRGMHYQEDPFGEVKIIRCTRGSLFDVIIDIRPKSPTYGHWTAIELKDDNHIALYVPEGFAHGFQTLEDNTEVLYYMSSIYHPAAARGLYWNDPTLAIEWPVESERIISENDQKHPHFKTLKDKIQTSTM